MAARFHVVMTILRAGPLNELSTRITLVEIVQLRTIEHLVTRWHSEGDMLLCRHDDELFGTEGFLCTADAPLVCLGGL